MWRDAIEAPEGVGLVLGGRDLSARLGATLTELGFRGTGLVVVDRILEDPFGPWMGALHDAGLDARLYAVGGGESVKSLEGLAAVYDAATRTEVARDGWFLAVGGGALSDLVGFGAATYLRGVPWGVVPTTLLSQVDAALGGKTAIDLPAGKNLAGAFHLPRLVLEDSGWLTTLPLREWRSGFGEILKTGLLTGGALWEAVRDASPPPGDNAAAVLALIEPAVRHKLRVVREDPKESGLRATLNLGHTMGHAFEAWHGFSGAMSHGEAVGVGLLFALRLSEETFGLPSSVRNAVSRVLSRWGMPSDLGGAPAGALRQILRHDKKRQGSRIRWVLLREVGHPELAPVDDSLVDQVLLELGAHEDGGDR